MDVFFELHSDNQREGPGAFESTQRAFSMLKDAAPHPTILDVGCGPGAQTLDLCVLTDGDIVAVDKHLPYLEALNRRICQRNLDNRIRLVHGDMFNLGFKEKSFDIIWSEGAIYIIGFENGLVAWRPLLRKPGYIVVSELTWLKPRPPSEVGSFWNREYPAMKDIARNLEILKEAGYSKVGHFMLPESAWWSSYYRPIEKKLIILRQEHQDDETALAILEKEAREIELFRKYSQYYGYVFYVGQSK